jgi:RimJ/RimL family protein N-acetyltransferase
MDRPPLIEIVVGLELRRALGGVRAAQSAAFEAREIGRDEVAAVLGAAPALRRSLEAIDVAAPGGWRCFVVFAGGAPVHVSFVETRPGRPVLFGALTEPAARGRGAFRAVVALIDERLHAEGEPTLYSSTHTKNRASVRAHLAAGFAIARRIPDVWLRGRSVRLLARAWLRRRA